MSRDLEGKRQRQRDRKASDPAAFNRRQRRYRADNPDYVSAIKLRVRRSRLNDPPLYLWKKARIRAAKEDMDFTISVADVVIPATCPVLGIPIGPSTWQDTRRHD